MKPLVVNAYIVFLSPSMVSFTIGPAEAAVTLDPPPNTYDAAFNTKPGTKADTMGGAIDV